MRKTRRDYFREARREPFELELENPPVDGPKFVTFADFNRISSESSYNLARNFDNGQFLRALLSPQEWELFWAEWRTVPAEETQNLVNDIMLHFGADPGKPAS